MCAISWSNVCIVRSMSKPVPTTMRRPHVVACPPRLLVRRISRPPRPCPNSLRKTRAAIFDTASRVLALLPEIETTDRPATAILIFEPVTTFLLLIAPPPSPCEVR